MWAVRSGIGWTCAPHRLIPDGRAGARRGWPVTGSGPPPAGNDAARPTFRGCHYWWRCARRSLGRCAGRGHPFTDVVGGQGADCVLAVIAQGITSVAVQRFRLKIPAALAGGARCVARTRRPEQRRARHHLVLPGGAARGRPRTVVVVLACGGRGRGFGTSARSSPSSRSHQCSSRCSRIHSASTIASASPSSTGSSRCVPVFISLTPFPDASARRSSDQALIAVFSSLLAILIRRGLAFSATGIVNRNTPSW
jgi:hypothetical protein